MNDINFLPIDSIKLDKSLICDENDDIKKRNFAKGIITLASSFDKKVTAVNVETKAQRDYLKTLGCHFAQGELWAAPCKNWISVSLGV